MKRGGFHNTINETGQMLLDFEAGVEKQEAVIMDFMEEHRTESFTPIQLWDRLSKLGYKYLLTSVRRALTNRTHIGELIRLDDKVSEKFGKPNYRWQFKCRLIKTQQYGNN